MRVQGFSDVLEAIKKFYGSCKEILCRMFLSGQIQKKEASFEKTSMETGYRISHAFLEYFKIRGKYSLEVDYKENTLSWV